MVDFAKVVLPNEAECGMVLEGLSQGPQKALALVAGLPAERQAFVFRALVWMVKMGVLKTG